MKIETNKIRFKCESKIKDGLRQILTNVLIGHFTKGKMRNEM